MKLNEKNKYLLCGITAGAMLVTTSPAIATQITQNISAVYNNIKIVVDGKQVTTDSHNEPFIYNGTTYLPVRAVGEAVGKEVTWDSNTNTVYLGARLENTDDKTQLKNTQTPKQPMSQSLLDVYDLGEYGWFEKNVTMGGKTYSNALGLFKEEPLTIDLNGKYNTLEFELGHAEEDATVNVINFYVDNQQVESITFPANQATTHYTISLNYGQQLKIEKVEGNRWMEGYDVFLAECMLR